MKRTNKPAGVKKGFWMISALIGLIWACSVVLYFFQTERAQEETALLNTVNYVKVQCATYTHYNEASESKSLLRALESTMQVSTNIAAETGNGRELDEQMLKESTDQLWLSGIMVLDDDGNIVCEYNKDVDFIDEVKTQIEKEAVLDIASYDEKVYSQRISHKDGSYVDMAVCERTDEPGIVATYYYTPAEYANNYTLTIQSLLDGYQKPSDGTIIVADDGVVIASNDRALIGQNSTDQEAIQKLKKNADSRHLMHLKANGVSCYGIMLKQRNHYIYAYVPDSVVFQTLPQNVIAGVFFYLVVLGAIWLAIRRARAGSLKREQEKELEYQKNLLEEAKKAEAANHAKTEFLQRMSHDIRTPLNGIRGMLDVGDYYGNDLEKQAECRGKIREASDILLEITNEVLDMSKLESGEIFLEDVPFQIEKILNETIDVLGKLAEERGIKVERKPIEVIHRNLYGSPVHIKRLLMNIMGNAVKYNKDYGTIRLSCRELPLDDEETARIELICQDTGIGMSKEFQQHLFEPFAQEQKGGTSQFGGTGLGMPIAKSLVEKMGGTITFESEQGKGTTFVIIIPFKIDRNSEARKEKAENCAGSIKGLNILLVEDNELNMEIAEFIIQSEGAVVTKAWNGREAVEIYKKSRAGEFDLILMDIMMPIMDGYEATRTIRSMDRKDASTIPIIAMTANAFTEDKMKSKEAGMNEHISKPIDLKQLIKVITVVVSEKETR